MDNRLYFTFACIDEMVLELIVFSPNKEQAIYSTSKRWSIPECEIDAMLLVDFISLSESFTDYEMH